MFRRPFQIDFTSQLRFLRRINGTNGFIRQFNRLSSNASLDNKLRLSVDPKLEAKMSAKAQVLRDARKAYSARLLDSQLGEEILNVLRDFDGLSLQECVSVLKLLKEYICVNDVYLLSERILSFLQNNENININENMKQNGNNIISPNPLPFTSARIILNAFSKCGYYDSELLYICCESLKDDICNLPIDHFPVIFNILLRFMKTKNIGPMTTECIMSFFCLSVEHIDVSLSILSCRTICDLVTEFTKLQQYMNRTSLDTNFHSTYFRTIQPLILCISKDLQGRALMSSFHKRASKVVQMSSTDGLQVITVISHLLAEIKVLRDISNSSKENKENINNYNYNYLSELEISLDSLVSQVIEEVVKFGVAGFSFPQIISLLETLIKLGRTSHDICTHRIIPRFLSFYNNCRVNDLFEIWFSSINEETPFINETFSNSLNVENKLKLKETSKRSLPAVDPIRRINILCRIFACISELKLITSDAAALRELVLFDIQEICINYKGILLMYSSPSPTDVIYPSNVLKTNESFSHLLDKRRRILHKSLLSFFRSLSLSESLHEGVDIWYNFGRSLILEHGTRIEDAKQVSLLSEWFTRN